MPANRAPALPGLPGPGLSRGERLALAAVLLWLLAAGGWYASAGLDPSREHFYDERYSFENVYGLLYTDSWRPVSAWYPSLAYLPQTALLAAVETLHRWTGAAGLVVHDGARFTPLAYLLARLTSLAYAAAAVIGLFALGRRLFSSAAGLLAALFLATAPQLLHHAALFKPDALLVATVVLVLLLSDRAAVRPGGGALLLAGFGVGLATSAKLNGAATAVAPLLAACFGGLRRRAALWLLAAAGAAAGLYLALNPFLGATLAYLARNRRLYEIQAGKTGGSHLGVLRREAELLLGSGYHGPLIGLLAFAGLVGWIVWVARGTPEASLRRRLAVPLGFFAGYSLLAAAATPFARFSLFVPVVPVTALAAAWALLAAARRLAPAWRGALLAALSALALFQGGRFVYRERVPETRQLVAGLASEALAPIDGRVLCVEAAAAPIGVRRGPVRAAEWVVERLADLAPEELDRCDAEVFPARRLAGEAAGAGRYRARLGRTGGARTETVRSRPFTARGEDLVVELHPWRPAGRPAEIVFTAAGGEPGRWRASLDGPAGAVTLALRLPLRGAPPPGARLEVDGREVPLLWVRNERRPAGALYQTARLALGEAALFELELPPGLEVRAAGYRRWEPPPAAAGRRRP